MGGEYEAFYDMCYNMAEGTYRIQHCDCDNHIRPSNTIDPCFTGYYDGCMADMPDDLSCCPGINATYSSATGYVNGGTWPGPRTVHPPHTVHRYQSFGALLIPWLHRV